MQLKNSGKSYSTHCKPYKNFMEALVRRKVTNPGLHVSLYFDAFFLGAFTINKESILARKLYDPKEKAAFTKWRDNQKALGLLDWIENEGLYSSGVRYIAGTVALKYINKLIIETSQIATKDDVSVVENRVDSLEKRVMKLENALGTLIEAKDPPVTGEKMEYYSANPTSLLM